MDVTWLLCDIVTGAKLTELPIDPGDTIRVVLASSEQATFTLPVYDDRCPADWATYLVAGKTMLVLVLDDVPVNAWVVLEPTIGDTTVSINATTLEYCCERTNVGDLDAADMDMALVGATLAGKLVTGFGFTVAYTPCGTLSQDYYDSTVSRSLLDAFNALMANAGGPEWRITLPWTDETHRGVEKLIEFRPRIGVDRVHTIFELRPDGTGNIDSYTRTPSYAAGKGATVLTGTSTPADGGTSDTSDPITSDLVEQGWPAWEDTVDFPDLDATLDADPTLDEDTELARRTATTLGQREHGTATWAIVGATPDKGGPRAGIDFDRGDTIHIQIAPQGRRDPLGGTAVMRVLGYELDPVSGKATPQVWPDPDDNGGS